MNIYFFKAHEAKDLNELFRLGFGDGQGLFCITYSDPDFKYRQCHSARRSLEDLMAIANTYFPNSTEKDVLKALSNAALTQHSQYVLGRFCNDIDKPVFRVIDPLSRNDSPVYGNIYFNSVFDEYDKGKSKYCVADIKKLLREIQEEELVTA